MVKFKILIFAIILAIGPSASADVHLSDLLKQTKRERREMECVASEELLKLKIAKQAEADRSHLLGQLAIWMKACAKAFEVPPTSNEAPK